MLDIRVGDWIMFNDSEDLEAVQRIHIKGKVVEVLIGSQIILTIQNYSTVSPGVINIGDGDYLIHTSLANHVRILQDWDDNMQKSLVLRPHETIEQAKKLAGNEYE